MKSQLPPHLPRPATIFSTPRLPPTAAHVAARPSHVLAIPPPRTCLHPAPHVRPHPPPSFSYKHVTTDADAPTSATKMGGGAAIDGEKLRSDLVRLLRSRRSEEVELSIEPAKPVENPFYQDANPPRFSEAMQSCPKANIENLKELLKEENVYLITEKGEQGRLPVLIISMKEDVVRKRPAIVFLHSTHKCKEWLRPLLEAYASRGYIAVAVDSRYHGERTSSLTTYREALISSWKKGDTMPFIFDTVWDLIKLVDYLAKREDIDPLRIGITGESLGGMHAWFAAAADKRYSVVVPIIGVQGFRWAIDNDMWQGRVDSIKPVFEEACIDMGKSTIDREVVEKVWNRIAPGLASDFDAPNTIPAIAPRPLLIINGENDPRCPLAGLEVPKSRASEAYEKAHCPEKFKLIAEPGIGHQMTALMVKEASDWFDRFLKQQTAEMVHMKLYKEMPPYGHFHVKEKYKSRISDKSVRADSAFQSWYVLCISSFVDTKFNTVVLRERMHPYFYKFNSHVLEQLQNLLQGGKVTCTDENWQPFL